VASPEAIESGAVEAAAKARPTTEEEKSCILETKSALTPVPSTISTAYVAEVA